MPARIEWRDRARGSTSRRLDTDHHHGSEAKHVTRRIGYGRWGGPGNRPVGAAAFVPQCGL